MPPGAMPERPRASRVFMLDAEAGEIRFGDGMRGARPPLGASVIADYEYSDGRAGNVDFSARGRGSADAARRHARTAARAAHPVSEADFARFRIEHEHARRAPSTRRIRDRGL
jgi:hypothetical protein